MRRNHSTVPSPFSKHINILKDGSTKERMLYEITERVPAIIAVYKISSGQYVYINKAVEKILGYKPEEFMKMNLAAAMQLVHPDDIEKIKNQNNEALKKANSLHDLNDEHIVTFEYRMLHKNGSYRWLHTDGIALQRSKNAQVEYVVNISIDITKRKEAEEQTTNKALNELQNIQYALDQSAIVAITNKSGVIEYVNDRFVQVSKYSKDELIGKTHRIINSGYHNKEFMKHLWDTILSGKVWRGEIRNKTKEGMYYWEDTTITPLLNNQGVPEQFIAIRYDISKRKDLERQKDDFIGIASHELKTPVTSLKGYGQVLHKRFVKQGDITSAKYMAKMEIQINKLNTLIQDLLNVTKIETGKMQFYKEEFDMNVLIDEIIESMQFITDQHEIHKKGIIKNTVFGDRERIGQVIINFISNAIKYSPTENNIIVNLSSDKKYIQVCVKDFGVGIPKINQKRIFERFYRVSGGRENTFPGLGLGLFISSEIIKRHRGKIWFESVKNKGSTFCFTLPVYKKRIN